jgi:hypothetical protein
MNPHSRSHVRSSLRALALPSLAASCALSFGCASAAPAPPPTAQSSSGETAPVLGSAQSFAVLGASTVTSTGATAITGNLGVSPGLAITGFPPGDVIGGAIHAGDAVAQAAQADVAVASGVLAAEACGTDLTGKDLGGLTLAPGVYCFSSSAQLTGPLVLDAGGHADAVFVFQIGSTLTTASGASVRVINGGDPCGVFWQVGSSATLGTGTAFAGNIFALASITLTTGASVSGRALARTGAVTLDTNAVSVGSCASVVTRDAGAPGVVDAAGPVGSDSGAVAIDAGTSYDAASLPAPDAGTPDAGEVDAGGGAQDAGAGDADTTCCSHTLCGAACVDLSTDPNNCGSCGNACATAESCASGSCAPTCD